MYAIISPNEIGVVKKQENTKDEGGISDVCNNRIGYSMLKWVSWGYIIITHNNKSWDI